MGKHHPPKYGGAYESLRFMASLARGSPTAKGSHAEVMPIRLRLITAAGQIAVIGVRRGAVSCHDERGHALPWHRVAGADGERLDRLLQDASGPAEAEQMVLLVMPDVRQIDIL